MNRVVVTGMGIISPIGNTIPSFWDNLTAGKGWIAVGLVIFAFWRPGRALFDMTALQKDKGGGKLC